MGIELSADDKAGMSPAEIEALTDVDAESHLSKTQGQIDDEARTAAAEEAEGEEGDPPAVAAAAETPPAAGEAAAPGAEGMPTLEELAALLDDEPAATPAAAPAPYTVDTRDIKAERVAVRGKIADIDTKWAAGEVTDAERQASLGPLQEQLDDLLIEQTRNSTLQEANQQTTRAQINAAVIGVMHSAKADRTIDYVADPKAQVQYDQFLNMLAADPDNAGKSATQIAQAAHSALLALRGISRPTGAPPPPAPAPAAPGKRDVPTATLSGVPAAAPVGMENDALDKLNALEGEDYEEALAALPQATQDAILRAADRTSMQFSKGTKRKGSSRAEAEAKE